MLEDKRKEMLDAFEKEKAAMTKVSSLDPLIRARPTRAHQRLLPSPLLA